MSPLLILPFFSLSFGRLRQARPVATLHEALRLSRLLPASQRPAALLLRPGTHFLAGRGPLGLEARDSGLSIVGQPGAVLSGGAPLRVVWRPYDVQVGGKNIWQANLSDAGLAQVPGLRLADGNRAVRARHPSADPERQGLHTPPNTGWNPAPPPSVAAQAWLPGLAARGPRAAALQVRVESPNRSSVRLVGRSSRQAPVSFHA